MRFDFQRHGTCEKKLIFSTTLGSLTAQFNVKRKTGRSNTLNKCSLKTFDGSSEPLSLKAFNTAQNLNAIGIESLLRNLTKRTCISVISQILKNIQTFNCKKLT